MNVFFLCAEEKELNIFVENDSCMVFFRLYLYVCLFYSQYLRGVQRDFGSQWLAACLGMRVRSESSIPTSSRRLLSSL